MFAQLGRLRALLQRLARHVAMVGDCSMGCRGRIQNQMESLAWDTIQTAWARRQSEDSMHAVFGWEIGHMWKKPFGYEF